MDNTTKFNNLNNLEEPVFNFIENDNLIKNKLINAEFNNTEKEFNGLTPNFDIAFQRLANLDAIQLDLDALQHDLDAIQQDTFRKQVVQDVLGALEAELQIDFIRLEQLEKVPSVEVVNPGIFTSLERKVKKKIEKLPYTNDWLEERFAFLEKRGYVPNPEGLLRTVLDNVDQVNESRNLRYLVTSGLSVELMTGYKRRHKDLDLVLMHPDVNDYPTIFGKTDNTSAHEFWGGLRLDNQFLTNTAMRSDNESLDNVYCAHPAITLVQKTSDAWGRSPREHDYQDSLAVGYWMMTQPERFKQRDLAIAKTALSAIDSPLLKLRTTDRLNAMFTNHSWFTSAVCEVVEQVAA